MLDYREHAVNGEGHDEQGLYPSDLLTVVCPAAFSFLVVVMVAVRDLAQAGRRGNLEGSAHGGFVCMIADVLSSEPQASLQILPSLPDST